MAKRLDERVRILSTWPPGADCVQVHICYPLRRTADPKLAPSAQKEKHNGKSFGDKRCRGSRKWTSDELTPWPNMYWLADPETVRRVGRLEHMGYVKRYQERLMASPEYEAAFEAAHRAYAATRWALLSEEDRAWCEAKGYEAVLRDTGVGGMRGFTQVDKGEFRWEFLVPWVNRSLTNIDKVVVCTSFVVASFTLQKLFDPGASVGVHVSNIAQFFSYAMGNPIGFRSLALLSSVSEIFGDVLETKNSGVLSGASLDARQGVDGEDIVPIAYNILFFVINSYYIVRWALTRDALLNALEWDEDAENVYRDCFQPLGFRRAQFSRLVPYTRIEANEGIESRLLTVQGEPLTDLFVLLEGSLEVRVGNTVATRLPPFQLVGEASLLENLQSPGGTLQSKARATIVALPGAKYVRWSQRTFYELQEEEDEFAEAVQLMIARTLSRKLGDARQQGSARGGVCSGAELKERELAKTAKWQEREVELKLEIDKSKAAVSSLRVTFISFVCLVGLIVYAQSILQL